MPSDIRPAWVRPARTATAFWMPTVVVLAGTLILLLLGPRIRQQVAQRKSMPEAAAAYVLLDGSYLALPRNPLANPWPNAGDATLPERDEVVARRLPLPEYTGLGSMLPWMPVQFGGMSNILPNLATWPVSKVLTGQSPATNTLTLTISAELQRCGFQFEVPPGVMTDTPIMARFQIELDAQGAVHHLLAEAGDNPASMRLLETAISRGHGKRAGRGWVLVAWGR